MRSAHRSANVHHAPGKALAGRSSAGRRALIAAVIAATVALAGSARADESTVPAATAGNLNIMIQVIWQVQEGCARYCWGTSQTQSAQQNATSVQVAVAASTAPDGAALAGNATTVIQVVIQTQLGCVKYCYDTSQLQAAEQQVAVTQVADAVAADIAGAANDASVHQLVLQFQRGCVRECHDTTSSRTVARSTTIDQTASSATGATGASGGPPTLDDILAALANVTAHATVDVVRQVNRAACLKHCNGVVQIQAAAQDDATTQRTIDLVAAQATVQVPVDDGPATASGAVAVAAAPEDAAPPPIVAPTPAVPSHRGRTYRGCARGRVRNPRFPGTRLGARRKVARAPRAERLCFVITDLRG